MLRMSCLTVGVLAILGIGATAHADPLPAPVTLSTVDQFERDQTSLVFVGIVSGQSTSSTFTLTTLRDDNSAYNYGASSNAANCEHDALLMMSRPGRFQLLLTPYSDYVRCRLIRLTQ